MIKENEKSEYKLYHKVRDHDHYTGKFRGAAHNICNLRYCTTKEIPVVFHNGSTYDFHRIINELAKEFRGNIDCLGENMEKYITFTVPLRKKKRKWQTNYVRTKFIDSYRFMSTSLSNLTDKLSEIKKNKNHAKKEKISG